MRRLYIDLIKKTDSLTIWIEISTISFVSELPEGGSRIWYFKNLEEEFTDVKEHHEEVMKKLVELNNKLFP